MTRTPSRPIGPMNPHAFQLPEPRTGEHQDRHCAVCGLLEESQVHSPPRFYVLKQERTFYVMDRTPAHDLEEVVTFYSRRAQADVMAIRLNAQVGE